MGTPNFGSNEVPSIYEKALTVSWLAYQMIKIDKKLITRGFAPDHPL
jgi:hypothetical protein